MHRTHSELLSTAVAAARGAGALLREGWGKPHSIEFKGETNLVTEVDHAADALIIQHLRAATPDFEILAEESGAHTSGSAFCWVIDPVDGTTNYAHHFPYFAVSIGLEENGESIVGVVFDPILEQLFTATRGQGAYLNGQRIQCSRTETVGQSIVSTGLTYDVWESERGIAEIVQMIKHARTVRINGCASLDIANVACGRMEAYCDTGLFPWDISAARLILTEAGGRFGLYGDSTQLGAKYCIATNAQIHDELKSLLIP
ncbi:MAG TPA: inositol monophosphatase family protein [Anaerolineae bacterium]|nr:inositol monophosphatase family protein [Anaerolineae bacterium]